MKRPATFLTPNPSPARGEGSRNGYVIFAVLIVVVVLSLAGYRYMEAMSAEYQVAVRTSEQAEARAFAISGLHYVMGHLSDPNTVYGTLGGNPYDNADFFSAIPVGDTTTPRGGGRFSIINVSDVGGAGEARYPLRYGVSDESAKLNINALILLDPTGEVLFNALMMIPNMTVEIADAIVDWVDADDTQRPSGAESGIYQGLAKPYLCKNGPLNSIEELLLVAGVTPQLLFGSDRNRNGVLDSGEETSGEFSRGWSEYLTCYGRELNVDSEGYPRIWLNQPDLATLSQQLLQAGLNQELTDYIVYHRSTNKARAAAPLTATQIFAPPEAIRELTQTLIDNKAQGTRRLSSVLSIFNTQMAMRAFSQGGGPGGGPPVMITPILPCPLNDPDVLDQMLPVLLDKCTTSDNSQSLELTPRVNVNTAPYEVLSALPGLTPDDVNAIVNARGGLTPNDAETLSGAWLVTAAQLAPAKFRNIERYISGKSTTYRVHSVGYFGQGGPVARVEAVIDTASIDPETLLKFPRIVYFRDMTDLGRGFSNLPR